MMKIALNSHAHYIKKSFTLWQQRYIMYMQCIRHTFISVYTGILGCFISDLCLFFLFNISNTPLTVAIYCALLPFAPKRVLIFNGWWIALTSLYTHNLMFLHLMPLIPLSLAVTYIKRFLYPTPLLAICAAVLFLGIDSSVLWAIGLTSTPFKYFTIAHIFYTIISTWALSRALFAGE